MGKPCVDVELAEKIMAAEAVVLEAFQLYGSETLAVSFNGGKDSVVMFDLVRRVIQQHGFQNPKLVFQFAETDPFPEMTQFVNDFAAEWGIRVEVLECKSFKEGLQQVADYGIKAVFMGTRQTDPDGKYLSHMTPCSPGWPPLVRVCPILAWDYRQIWQYTLQHKLPYCSLYDKGYTSVGTVRNTQPNPLLRVADSNEFRPAYELVDIDGEYERISRISSKNSAAKTPAARSTSASSTSRTTTSSAARNSNNANNECESDGTMVVA